MGVSWVFKIIILAGRHTAFLTCFLGFFCFFFFSLASSLLVYLIMFYVFVKSSAYVVMDGILKWMMILLFTQQLYCVEGF